MELHRLILCILSGILMEENKFPSEHVVVSWYIKMWGLYLFHSRPRLQLQVGWNPPHPPMDE